MASANDKIADAIRKHSVLLSRYTETEQKAIHRRMTQLFLELKKVNGRCGLSHRHGEATTT